MYDKFCSSMLCGYSLWEVLPFLAIVFGALWIDLKAHKKDEPISIKNAASWSVIWVAVSLAFAGYVGITHGAEKSSLFLSGYFLEKSLSVDNLFVFIAIFASFGIKDEYQHRVLYFGILGALVLRFLFIGFGTGLAMMSPWALFIFGLIVLWSAYAMWKGGNDSDDVDYAQHWAVRYTSKIWPVYPKIENHNFFTVQNGVKMITPLFLALVCVEVSDIAFALDSVPAVISVTQEPFLVYTSNIFAILGLRSMYFLLAAAKRFLCHLETAVIGILVFIGGKMVLGVADVITFGKMSAVHISPMISLAIVLGGLVLGIVASLVWPEKEEA